MKYDPKVTEFSFAIGMDNFVPYEPGLSTMKCKAIISTGKAFTYKNKFLGQGPPTDNTQATPGEIPVAAVISSLSSKREAITKPMLQPNLCLYEVVSMLKCCSCNAVFHDMTSLLHHYQTTHLADSEGPPVCIKVSTADKNTLHQCNQRAVVCHKCGSTIPASTLEGFASKVNIPACKENNISEANLSPANNPFYETASSSSFPSSMNLLDSVDTPGSERAGDNFITTAADCSALDERSPSPDPIIHHHPSEGCQDSTCADTAISFLEESYLNNKYVTRDLTSATTLANSSAAAADDLFVDSTSSPVQVDDNSTDGSSVFSEDDDVSRHSEGKKDGGNDCATQVYVLDVLGGTDMEDVSQSNDAELLEQPPRRHLKLTGNPAPPLVVPKKPKIHKCRKGCRARFSSIALLELHESCHRPGAALAASDAFICPYCSFTMKKWYALQRHLWTVHQRDVDMLQCSICTTFRAHNECSLRVHMETHSESKPYACQTCGQKFRQLSQLLNHSKSHQNLTERQQPAAQCAECGMQCGSKALLARHIRNVHNSSKVHRCHVCSYASNRSTELRNHMRRHNKEKLFECCVCNARFCDQTSHRRHLLRHLPLSLLQCPLCSFHTSAPLHFTKHFSSRHKLQSQLELCFECKLCGEKSIDLKSYCAHSRSHHSDLLQQLVAQHQPTEAPG